MPNRQFLLQMAGVPGSGKSALARLIGRGAKAVVLDKDVLKTAALEGGADEELASGVAYDTFFALAGHLL
ncbi:MAG: ATP-binding protein, partial [Chloroflexi bacterium]|nr:ATP-binding protein [Chloroflexota bacterium]